MSRWWRAYDEAVDDPKLCLLSDKQHRAWFNLCCITSQNGGKLPPIAAVAFKLRMTVPKAKSMVAELVALGLVDNDEGAFAPHNWNARQYKTDITDPTTADRSKRYRDRKRDGDRDESRDAAVTVTGTRAETEQITEQKVNCPDAKAPRTKLEYSEDFETNFWVPYPRSPTMAKKEAWREWMKLTPEQRSAACQAIEPYKKYLRTKPNLETVHACRFLSQQRFDGFVNGAPSAPPAFDIRSHLV